MSTHQRQTGQRAPDRPARVEAAPHLEPATAERLSTTLPRAFRSRS